MIAFSGWLSFVVLNETCPYDDDDSNIASLAARIRGFQKQESREISENLTKSIHCHG